MPTTAPHLDQLELADSLRDHVFTLVRAGEMNAALILIRADLHSAASALAAAAEANGRTAVASVAPSEEEGETDDADAEEEPGDAAGPQKDPQDVDTVKKVPVQMNAG